MIKDKISYEWEMITQKGSYHGMIYIISQQNINLLYFKSWDEEDQSKFKFIDDLYKSLEESRRKGWKEFIINIVDIHEVVSF